MDERAALALIVREAEGVWLLLDRERHQVGIETGIIFHAPDELIDLLESLRSEGTDTDG